MSPHKGYHRNTICFDLSKNQKYEPPISNKLVQSLKLFITILVCEKLNYFCSQIYLFFLYIIVSIEFNVRLLNLNTEPIITLETTLLKHLN